MYLRKQATKRNDTRVSRRPETRVSGDLSEVRSTLNGGQDAGRGKGRLEMADAKRESEKESAAVGEQKATILVSTAVGKIIYGDETLRRLFESAVTSLGVNYMIGKKKYVCVKGACLAIDGLKFVNATRPLRVQVGYKGHLIEFQYSTNAERDDVVEKITEALEARNGQDKPAEPEPVRVDTERQPPEASCCCGWTGKRAQLAGKDKTLCPECGAANASYARGSIEPKPTRHQHLVTSDRGLEITRACCISAGCGWNGWRSACKGPNHNECPECGKNLL